MCAKELGGAVWLCWCQGRRRRYAQHHEEEEYDDDGDGNDDDDDDDDDDDMTHCHCVRNMCAHVAARPSISHSIVMMACAPCSPADIRFFCMCVLDLHHASELIGA